jgi:hypothetical protein
LLAFGGVAANKQVEHREIPLAGKCGKIDNPKGFQVLNKFYFIPF